MNEIIESLQMKNDLVNTRKLGQIPQIYKDTMYLYFDGKDYKEIAKILGISETAANTRLTRLRKLGLIGKKQTKTETVMEFIKIGISDNNEIATLLGINYFAASKLKREANKRLKMQEENLGVNPKKEIKIITPELIPEIKRALSYMYPVDIASIYDISLREVYDVIYSLTKEEENNIRREALKQNSLYGKVKDLIEKENLTVKEAVDRLFDGKPQVQDIVEMARIYYMTSDELKAQRILMKTAYDKKVNIEQRIIAREEADKMHFDHMAKLVRKDYMTRKISGELTYFDDLIKKYNVGYTFLEEVIGPEDEIDFNDLDI